MSGREPELDAETLRAELDLRWPDAVGAMRAETDEHHRLVLCHPEFDGFISLHVTARTDLDGVFVVPDESLAPIITSHHRTGPLQRGEVLPIDLELHPGNVRRPASDGWLRIVTIDGSPVAPGVRLTVATDGSFDCLLAGEVDGPFDSAETFGLVVEELCSRRGRGYVRQVARRIEALAAGDDDPGTRSRMPWRSR